MPEPHRGSDQREVVTLAIDTSCDETAVAVTHGWSTLANVIASQANLHARYGGVFPTLAKQAHQENLLPAVRLALTRSGLDWPQIDQIAVTVGPGLAPALGVGIAGAIELGQQYHKPVIAANHIEGHILSVLAQPKARPSQSFSASRPKNLPLKNSRSKVSLPTQEQPILSIVVSGGHTLFVAVSPASKNQAKTNSGQLDRQPSLKLVPTVINQKELNCLNSGQFSYQILGQTLDDAAGECLDKIGRMVNLGYPAGPVMEQLAIAGDPQKYKFPLPLTTRADYDLSFAGLKTYARNLTEKMWGQTPATKPEIADFCASAQYAIFHHICYKLNKLLQTQTFAQVWLGGGVAANVTLRKMLRQTIRQNSKHVTNIKLAIPYSKKLCGDNAVMIGVCAK